MEKTTITFERTEDGISEVFKLDVPWDADIGVWVGVFRKILHAAGFVEATVNGALGEEE